MREIEKFGAPEKWYFSNLKKLVNSGISRKKARSILKPGYIIMITDALTGVYNRRKLFMRLDDEVKLAREERPLSLIMLDLDYFKRYNDTYGHPQGDEALIGATHAIREKTRDTDFLSRYGGEEFTLVLPKTSLEGAKIITEKVRKNVEDMVIEASSENLKEGYEKITISQGATWYNGNPVKTAEQLIKEADVALYEAKKERNRVCFYHLL